MSAKGGEPTLASPEQVASKPIPEGADALSGIVQQLPDRTAN